MRSRVICFTSIVLDPKYDNLPGMEYYGVEVDGEVVRFAQHAHSVIPAMLTELVRPHPHAGCRDGHDRACMP